MVENNIKGIDYFKLALFSLAGICLELLLILIEPFLYRQSLDFNNWTVISHWSITYLLWVSAIFFILKYAKEHYGFKLKESRTNPRLWQYVAVVCLILLSFAISYMNWNGFKVQKEWLHLGMLKFIMQYVYYFMETMLFTLIIVFGQKAFEKWFKNENIPYGGIVCALTWGLGHIITKSSIEVGLFSAVAGFGFGAVYLLLNRNLIKTFPVIFLMFVL